MFHIPRKYKIIEETYALRKSNPRLTGVKGVALESEDFSEIVQYIRKKRNGYGNWLLSLWLNDKKVATLTRLSPEPKKPFLRPCYLPSDPKAICPFWDDIAKGCGYKNHDDTIETDDGHCKYNKKAMFIKQTKLDL